MPGMWLSDSQSTYPPHLQGSSRQRCAVEPRAVGMAGRLQIAFEYLANGVVVHRDWCGVLFRRFVALDKKMGTLVVIRDLEADRLVSIRGFLPDRRRDAVL